MQVQTMQINKVRVLSMNGRFDAYNTSYMERWLKEVELQSPPQAVIDLSSVNFIDSTGLAVLVAGMKRCRERRGDLYLCALQQPVRIILELTWLDRVFQIFSSCEEAVERFSHES